MSKYQCPKCKTWKCTIKTKTEMIPHLDPPRRTVTIVTCDNCRNIISAR